MHRTVVEDHRTVVTAPRALPTRRVPRHRLALPLLAVKHSVDVRAKRIPPVFLALPRQRRRAWVIHYRRSRRDTLTLRVHFPVSLSVTTRIVGTCCIGR